MPKPKKYPYAYYIRLSGETKRQLAARAKQTKTAPAVLGRTYIESGLSNDLKKEDHNVKSAQETK